MLSMAGAALNVESELSSVLNLYLREFILKSLKDKQTECIRPIICLREVKVALALTSLVYIYI